MGCHMPLTAMHSNRHCPTSAAMRCDVVSFGSANETCPNREGMRPIPPERITTMRRMAIVFSAVLIMNSIAGTGSVLAETRTVPHGDAVIEYHIDGKGPLVLMIPSLGRPASDFDDLAARLAAAGYTTVRPEPRGIGRSSGPMKDVTLGTLAADFLAPVPNGSDPIIVIGHAFGQRVARTLATQYPD